MLQYWNDVKSKLPFNPNILNKTNVKVTSHQLIVPPWLMREIRMGLFQCIFQFKFQF